MLEIDFENGVFKLILKHLIIRTNLHKKNRMLFENHFREDPLWRFWWESSGIIAQTAYRQKAVIVLSCRRNSSVS